MKLIILDRDGVINYDSDAYIKSPQEWQPIPGSLEAIAALNRAGYQVAVATNQSGIARGYYNLETLAAIHRKMEQALSQVGGEIAWIAYCPHGPQDNCLCRKPLPGLLLQIAHYFQRDSLADVFMIGDTLRDIQAAQAAGAKPILVKSGKDEVNPASHPSLASHIPVFDDLATTVAWLLANE